MLKEEKIWSQNSWTRPREEIFALRIRTPIPFLVVPMLLPPNSTSSRPSTRWCKSKTICARSLMKIRDRTSFKP
jgi:hypothetical protein